MGWIAHLFERADREVGEAFGRYDRGKALAYCERMQRGLLEAERAADECALDDTMPEGLKHEAMMLSATLGGILIRVTHRTSVQLHNPPPDGKA